jgi:hypothetical protein
MLYACETRHTPDFGGAADVKLDNLQQLLAICDVQRQSSDRPTGHTPVRVLACVHMVNRVLTEECQTYVKMMVD